MTLAPISRPSLLLDGGFAIGGRSPDRVESSLDSFWQPCVAIGGHSMASRTRVTPNARSVLVREDGVRTAAAGRTELSPLLRPPPPRWIGVASKAL